MVAAASATFNSVNTVDFSMEHAQQNNTPTSTASTPTSNTQKVEQIFNARVSVRRKMATDKKIKIVASIALILIGTAAVSAASILALAGGLPVGAAVVMALAGHFLSGIGAFMPIKRILKDEEEKQFWKAISIDSLSALTSKRWNWYCVGSPYHGLVEGVCKITYTELQHNGLMRLESAKKLQTLLDRNKKLEDTEAQEIRDLEKINPDLVVPNSKERIRAKYIPSKMELQDEFEAFRNAFIQESYLKYCKR
jgi:hypothetical protein